MYKVFLKQYSLFFIFLAIIKIIPSIANAKPTFWQRVEAYKAASTEVDLLERKFKAKEIRPVFSFSKDPGSSYDLWYRNSETRHFLLTVESFKPATGDPDYEKTVSQLKAKYPKFGTTLKKASRRSKISGISRSTQDFNHRSKYIDKEVKFREYKKDSDRKKIVFMIDGASALIGSFIGYSISKHIVPKIIEKISQTSVFQKRIKSNEETVLKCLKFSLIGLSTIMSAIGTWFVSDSIINKIENRFILQ